MYRVLIVDDSNSFRKLVSQYLKTLEKMEILEAEDGVCALELLKKEAGKIDLILLDFYMPRMDGLAFYEKLVENKTFRNIPVVMITTSDDKKRMVAAVRSGIKHYLTKPFTPEDLLTMVVKVLGLSFQ